MSTECFDVKTKEGRTVAVWRDSPPDKDATGPVVVMAPGFGQRMRSSGVLALMLTYNGATVYRFDALDHVGLSDGEIVDYSTTQLMEALTAVVDTVCEREGVASVSMVATSLSALPVLQLAADRKCADNIALMLGVVNGRQTLLKVLDTDYLDWELDDLPARVQIDKHSVDPRPIVAETRVVGWWELSATVDALSVLNIPVRNFVATDDDWVDIADVRTAFEAANLDQGNVVEVAVSGHALLRNPVALKALLTDVTRSLVGGDDEPVMPSFEEIVSLRGSERELERRHLASRTGGRTEPTE
ncbi:hypothetical protein SGFS_036630 [Streptomyces graminofaciens]|uniref:Acyl transferase n=1 Tax=Streptomyces graminofaciens TaxID=68212 RepID=A0ABN5VGI2_9ACTN|nr:hypothetical protein [Streptomyces graminofaciens]BBC32369.1 hypothetical protein SGFS_036630 [Streptomyces graminofaciens]